MANEAWPDWDVYVRDKCICAYCGLDGKKDIRIWGQLQIDQIIPRKLGGSNTRENKVVACTRCNTLKGDKDPRQNLPRENQTSVSREDLIQISKQLIREGSIRKDEETDYKLMMDEIKQIDS